MKNKNILISLFLTAFLNPGLSKALNTESNISSPTYCLSYEEAQQHYPSKDMGETETVLPPDYVSNNLRMAKDKNFVIGDNNKVSTVQEFVVDQIHEDYKISVNPYKDQWDTDHFSHVRFSCYVTSEEAYKSIGASGRSTALSEKLLSSNPTIKNNQISFKFNDDRGNHLKYICEISGVLMRNGISNWAELATVKSIDLNLFIILLNVSGAVDGTICPATLIQGEDQNYPSSTSFL